MDPGARDATRVEVNRARSGNTTLSSLSPATPFELDAEWADKGSEAQKRKPYQKLSEATMQFVNACYEDGQQDPSLRWTAEMIHHQLMSSSRLSIRDKIALKLGKVKQLLKPLTPAAKEEQLEKARLIEEAKDRRARGEAPAAGEPVWVLHFPRSANEPEWVDLKSGIVRLEEPALHADQEADDEAAAAVEDLFEEAEAEVEVYDEESASVAEVDPEKLTVHENEFLQDGEQLVFGPLVKFRKIIHRVYYVNGLPKVVQAQYNEEIVKLLRVAEMGIKSFFEANHCDYAALNTDASIYSVLPSRKADSYFRQEVYADALQRKSEVPSPAELRAAWAQLSPDEKKEFEDRQLQDEKRYMLERHVYNLSALQPVFERGDKVAWRTADKYVVAEVVSGCGEARNIKDAQDKVHNRVRTTQLTLLPQSSLPTTWLQDVCIGDKVYALKSTDDTEFAYGVVREVGETAHSVEFSGSRLQVPAFQLLLKSKTKMRQRKETGRVDTTSKSSTASGVSDKTEGSLLGMSLAELKDLAEKEGLPNWKDLRKKNLRLALEKHLKRN